MFNYGGQSADAEKWQGIHSNLAEMCLEKVSESAPVIRETLGRYGRRSISDYLDTLIPPPVPPYQSRQDFLALVQQDAASLLGDSIASKTAKEIDVFPMVLTANHLGVDYFSQSVQGSLLFFLLKRKIASSPVVLPVIACGSVPLDNVTYPLGVLLYRLGNGHLDIVPKKLPVFANKIRRALVSVAPPFDIAMVERARKRLEKMVLQEELDQSLAGALDSILREDYQAPSVLDLCSYSHQSLVVNNRIWQRLFTGIQSKSHILTLEMEAIVSRLLEFDLHNPKSLISSVLMDPDLRDVLIDRLDTKRACWNLNELRMRLDICKMDMPDKKMPNSCGTHFFWGVDERRRRIPLCLLNTGKDQWVLKGADEHGKEIEVVFSVESILSALQNKTLLPSLFTSFTVLAFARGITCLGGYYQGEYLPMMHRELVAAMREVGLDQEATRLSGYPGAPAYLSGMQTVMTRIEQDALIPAGPIEIIAGGGLTDKDLDHILSLSVRDAHLASLFDTVGDIAPRMNAEKGLKRVIARDCCSLSNKVVVK